MLDRKVEVNGHSIKLLSCERDPNIYTIDFSDHMKLIDEIERELEQQGHAKFISIMASPSVGTPYLIKVMMDDRRRKGILLIDQQPNYCFPKISRKPSTYVFSSLFRMDSFTLTSFIKGVAEVKGTIILFIQNQDEMALLPECITLNMAHLEITINGIARRKLA